ncbi:MAG: PEP/pyruvate-binding domain-containing protein, partial [Anaerolineales bacterium]
ERMSILLQVVEGETFGEFFLPHASGVAYSRNLYRWAPQIQEEAGFLRLVWGLGTRAVDRSGDDYVRLVALSHPTLHPEADIRATRNYSQKYVDLINLQKNSFETIPVQQVLRYDYPPLRYIAQIDDGGFLTPIQTISHDIPTQNAVLTFDELFKRTKLAPRFTHLLQLLEKYYHSPVDLEFALEISEYTPGDSDVQISILQCRPQLTLEKATYKAPTYLEPADVLFSTSRMAPSGQIEDIRYVVFITPESYFQLPSEFERAQLRQIISQVNRELANETFILMGPGRWGTSNPELGIPVGFGDIYHARALIEITGQGIGPAPEASYGTHFFQDLIESNIYPLAIYLDDPGTVFQKEFFDQAPNHLPHLIPQVENIPACLRVIDIRAARPGYCLQLIMDTDKKIVMAYFEKEKG